MDGRKNHSNGNEKNISFLVETKDVIKNQIDELEKISNDKEFSALLRKVYLDSYNIKISSKDINSQIPLDEQYLQNLNSNPKALKEAKSEFKENFEQISKIYSLANSDDEEKKQGFFNKLKLIFSDYCYLPFLAREKKRLVEYGLLPFAHDLLDKQKPIDIVNLSYG